MNILFFLTPKAMCSYVDADSTLRQAMERMENSGYTALPILDAEGHYKGVITEGDLLWGMKDRWPDFPSAEKAPLAELPRGSRQHQAVLASTDFSEVMARALEQNYVPVVDDRGMFIGIVTRRRILTYLYQHLSDPEVDPGTLAAAVRGMMG